MRYCPGIQQQTLEQTGPATPFKSAVWFQRLRIDYTESPPVLAVKLQEMFGCEQSPGLLSAGKVPLAGTPTCHPAGKPLQITQDLAGFWRSSYHDVKKDMKGRYPKHPWPDDPLTASATRKTRVRKS